MSSPADPHWTTYVAMATGLAGLIAAIIAHIRVNKMKRVEEWREVAIELNRAKDKVDSLPGKISDAVKWHKSARVATGTLHSGGMQRFQSSMDALAEKASRLKATLDSMPPEDFEHLSVEDLVRARISIAKIDAKAEFVIQECEEERREAQREVDHYRADIRERPR